jgi:glucose-1-phosphate cytidylyltransferase
LKAVILAGGRGTRISDESTLKPKPMIEIGGRPILWHIMKTYSAVGVNDFIVCCGYRGYVIKEYFANYLLHMSDVTFDMSSNKVHVHENRAEPWRVTVVDTGLDTMTGGRLKRVRSYIGDETFCMTYGDGLADLDIQGLIDFHRKMGKKATVTTVQPPGRFGAITVDQHIVQTFNEKPQGDGGWINGGFFVLEPSVIDSIDGDATTWERDPLERLAAAGELVAYRHTGFWMPMDTPRDKAQFDDLWQSGRPPWKTW